MFIRYFFEIFMKHFADKKSLIRHKICHQNLVSEEFSENHTFRSFISMESQ